MKMMNNKGLTIVELIASFALISTIILILIEVLISIKDIYTETNLKTSLYIEQSNLSKILNEKINYNNIVGYYECEEVNDCYNFLTVDGTILKLSLEKNRIIFDNYTYNIIDGGYVDLENVSIGSNTFAMPDVLYDSLFYIIIPVKHKLFSEDDYGIRLIYQYNSNKVTL